MPAMNSPSIRTTGVLNGGIPNGTGTATFTVHATDLVEPAQPAVDATFNITVVAAVTVDDIVIPDGHQNVTTSVNLTASGGETPFQVDRGVRQCWVSRRPWSATPCRVTANGTGAFDVQVTVDDSLGGTNTKTLTYNVSAPGVSTPTPTAAPTNTATVTSTLTATPTNTTVVTNTPTAPTKTPTTATPTPTSTTCVGDCTGTHTVAINDLITLVNIALGTAQPSACRSGVASGAEVTVAMIIQAVNNALNGCPVS